MKKVFTLLWSVLALLMVANVAQAQDFTLYFGEGTGDKWSLWKDNALSEEYIENTETWEAAENKLTLDGFTFETTAGYGLYITTDTEIVVTGTGNSIVASTGIAVASSTTGSRSAISFTGTGTLEVKGKKEGIYHGGNLTINGPAIIATGEDTFSPGVIVSGDKTTFLAGSLTASSPYRAVEFINSINTSDIAAKGNVDGNNTPLVDATYNSDPSSKSYEIGGVAVKYLVMTVAPAGYTLFFGEIDGNWSLFKDQVAAGNEYTENTDKWSAEANKLTLSDFHFSTTVNVAFRLNADVTLVLSGDNSLTSTGTSAGTSAISTGGKNLTIQGDGTLELRTADNTVTTTRGIAASTDGTVTIGGNATVTAIAGDAAKGSSYGIHAKNLIIQDNATVIASAGAASESLYSYGVCVEDGTFTMTGGKLTASSGEGGTSAAIKTPEVTGVIVKGGADSDATTELVYDAAGYKIAAGDVAKYAVMTLPPVTLYFGKNGEDVWSLYTNPEFTTPYAGNDGKWSAEANKLTLDGFTFETTANTALVLPNVKTTIEVADGTTNTITVNASETAYGIQGATVDIQGGGTLDVNATGTISVYGIRLTGSDISGSKISEATVNVSATGGTTANTALYTLHTFAINDGGALHADGSSDNNKGIGIYNQGGIQLGTYLSVDNTTMGSLAVQGGKRAIESIQGVMAMQDGFVYSNSANYDGTDATTPLAAIKFPTAYWVSDAANQYINMKPQPTTKITSFPHTEGFESDTYLYWTAISYSTKNSPGITEDGANSGNYSWEFHSGVEDTVYDQYLISPELAATTGSKTLSFYYLTAPSTEEEFRVGYSTTDNAVGSFTWFEPKTALPVATNEWQLYTAENIPANAKYIAIHYLSKKKSYLLIDDITISGTSEQGGETGIYHTITLDIAAGIELHNMTAGNHSVEEGSHLHLQFLPEDRTLTAADILFLIDGVETAFTELGENNFFSYILNPVSQDHTILVALKEYPVILPEVEGVTYDVGAGTHLVGYGEKFTFSLTLADGIDPEKVHVYANGREISPSNLPQGEALRASVLPISSPLGGGREGALMTYTIDKVLTPITVVIEGAGDPVTGNGNIAHGDIQLRITNYELQIENTTAQAVDVNVYTVQGKSVVSLRALRGSKTISLQPGIYIVKAGNEVFKVFM